jgi:hypothetical protein
MPSLNSDKLERALTRKLRATVEDDRRDRQFSILDDAGDIVAVTYLSHSWQKNTALSAQMVSIIKRELRLKTSQQLVEVVSCALSREGYLAIAAAEP